jgi:hypothetical protein
MRRANEDVHSVKVSAKLLPCQAATNESLAFKV